MSPVFATLTPTDILGPLVVGALLACLVVIGLLLWKAWRRKQFGIRPPLKTNLLRPAGHSLQLQVHDTDQGISSALASVMLLGGALAVLVSIASSPLLSPKVAEWLSQNGGWMAFFHRQLLPSTLTVLLFGCGALGGLIYESNRFLGLCKKQRELQLGLRGEQAVAEALLEVAHLGYRAFHDLPAGKDWNIDHVVVGPGGVFTLETKTRSKCTAPAGQEETKVYYDGKALRFPWGKNTSAVPQAAGAAKWLTEFLHRSTGRTVEVEPLLIIPGWYVERTAGSHAVKAMNTSYLTKFLRGLPTSLSMEDVHVLAHPISEKCRDVEF